MSIGSRSVVHEVVKEDLGLALSGKIDNDFDSSWHGKYDDRSRDVTLLDGDAMGAFEELGNCHVEPLVSFSGHL